MISMIVLMAGLPGSGKTTLARSLSTHLQGRILGKDEIRHAIFTPQEIEYSSRQDDFCMQVMLEVAGFLLSRDPDKAVFLDGRPFSRRYQIESVVTFATSIHQPWRIVECICSESTARRRLNADEASGGHPAGNRDYGLYLGVKERFEAITKPKLVVNTEEGLEVSVQKAIAYLRP